MKFAFVLVQAVFAFSAMAEADLAQVKADVTAELDKRIASLQEAKTCVANATDHNSIKKCRQEMKADRMDMRKEHMEKRKGRLEERIKKMDEKKSE